MSKVIAMYDIRGIQKYIYRTQKVKDAMGASALVEDIIERALSKAAKGYKTELKWYEEGTGAIPFVEKAVAVQVLFIGGGNAYVLFENAEVCREISAKMSRIVLEETYSLQLAAASVPKTESYSEDYRKLHEEMNRVKANIKSAKPVGALPIMQTEIKTGYPIIPAEGDSVSDVPVSTETYKKDRYKRRVVTEEEEKIFDNLIYEKYVDSNLAVVHIDGNNMGLRIRQLIQDKKEYDSAVNEMRKISYHIKTSYLSTFEDMREKFEAQQTDENKRMVRKIVVAGDDITYVCNARIALDTVEYFAGKIAEYTMNGERTPDAHKLYGFSICAGVAYMKSHFPFSIAYDVAEACCDSAKGRAKSGENKEIAKVRDEQGRTHAIERIGNYVDFQICGSIQCRNLDEMRRRDYVTPTGEQLLTRPYYIPTKYDGGLAKEQKVVSYHYDNFKQYVQYFIDEKHIPRSYAKRVRNTYPLGSHEMKMLEGFLQSRSWKMPDGSFNMFQDGRALWYDALEMMDYCVRTEDDKNA